MKVSFIRNFIFHYPIAVHQFSIDSLTYIIDQNLEIIVVFRIKTHRIKNLQNSHFADFLKFEHLSTYLEAKGFDQ